MRLAHLLPGLWPDADPVEITGLSSDSRTVEPGFVFFACAGTQDTGLRYVADAVSAGAVAIVSEDAVDAGLAGGARVIPVADVRRDLALAAARFHPRQPETIVAVTGTAGKTSVADFTRQIFAACGHEAASLGTLGVMRADGLAAGGLTTPDPVRLHATLDGLARDGVTHLAMEASSHGIDQRRLDGVRLSAAAFTNLGHDHLDYHGTREAYLAAKLRLFDTLLPEAGTMVIPADVPEAVELSRIAKTRGLNTLSVGEAGADLTLSRLAREGFDQRLSVMWRGRTFTIRLPLAGAFQASNALIAAGLALAVGEDPERVFEALSGLTGVPGRLERVATHQGALVVVDYAHKPEALEHALAALRPFVTGRLILVFGCGGDRDRVKRPVMGAIAARVADLTIVTDDNPRSEDPAAIRRAILAACPGAREIGDRREAIRTALSLMAPGDVVLIAGKGHETGQIVGDVTLPFSDRAVVLETMDGLAR